MASNLEEFRNSQIEQAKKEVEYIINQGAPIVTMSIFDILVEYKPDEIIKSKIDYTMELYFELLNKIKEFNEENQYKFLKLLKDSDVIDNQSIEKEDSFLISMRKAFTKDFAIDRLIKISGQNLSKEEFIDIHDQLLSGTTSENKLGLRKDNLKFVGTLETNPDTKYFVGNRAISYFPIRYTEIDEAIDKFLLFYNENRNVASSYDALLVPIIYHGLIAALQLFNDGNTRYGRLLQNVEMFRLINENYNIDQPLPIVYATRQYAGYRNEYRGLVENLVINNDIEAWNKWIKFNLNRIQDGIVYNEVCLEKLQNSNHQRRY